MSVVKLLSRIVAPTDEVFEDQDHGKKASTMHDHTFGITSDPLTQFACVLSALIHDGTSSFCAVIVFFVRGALFSRHCTSGSTAQHS